MTGEDTSSAELCENSLDAPGGLWSTKQGNVYIPK
jgi:hypothetical protein